MARLEVSSDSVVVSSQEPRGDDGGNVGVSKAHEKAIEDVVAAIKPVQQRNVMKIL